MLSSRWLFSTWSNCWCWLASLAIISRIRRPPVGSPVPPGREGGRGVEARMWGSAAALHWCYSSLQWKESPPTQATELAATGGSRVHPEPCIGSALEGVNPDVSGSIGTKKWKTSSNEITWWKSDLAHLCCFPQESDNFWYMNSKERDDCSLHIVYGHSGSHPEEKVHIWALSKSPPPSFPLFGKVGILMSITGSKCNHDCFCWNMMMVIVPTMQESRLLSFL